jgi:hypothetical protein
LDPSLLVVSVSDDLLGEVFASSMEQPVPDFHPELYGQTKKPGLLAKAGLLSTT